MAEGAIVVDESVKAADKGCDFERSTHRAEKITAYPATMFSSSPAEPSDARVGCCSKLCPCAAQQARNPQHGSSTLIHLDEGVAE